MVKSGELLPSTDVFVIGGGPAGLAAAIAARLQGFRVTIADGAKKSPIDKACGEALMPEALEALEQLGVRIPDAESFPVHGTRFCAGGLSAEAVFPIGCRGISVRRTVLHRLLVERATELNIDLRWHCTVTGISRHAIQTGDGAVGARWIIGADGANSRVRRWANLQSIATSGLRYSFRRHYGVRPWTDRMEIYWGKDIQGYMTGVNDHTVCVAIASHDPGLRLERSLSQFPELKSRLRGVEPVSVERGAISANRRLRRVCRGNIALVGDASGTVDAITGEGLGLAFHQALVLARCMKSGALADYECAHRRLAFRPLLMARLMLALDGRVWLQRRTLQVFKRHPEIFDRLLAFHVGALSPAALAVEGLNLGWGLLTAQ
jgi:menaquinone-9 beta-reductase